jgi:transposase
MEGILPELEARDKKRIKEQSRQCQDAALKTRYMIVVNLIGGQTVAQTASALQVGRSTVDKVAKRFREHGEAGLVDRREENGRRKMDDDYLTQRHEIVAGSAQDYGWRRPTWTREMLTATMTQLTRVRIHVSTMSRALKQIGARLGRPKPVVGCPWPECRKNRRLQAIQEIVDQLPKDGVAVYEDEVNIHLNPKIGPDWMMRGQQKEVLTPGRNGKRYLAGAVDWRTNELIWVEGQKKNTLLFIQLLWKPVQHDSNAKVIHVIPDNFSIHSTKQVEISLTTEHGLR